MFLNGAFVQWPSTQVLSALPLQSVKIVRWDISTFLKILMGSALGGEEGET